MSMAKREMQDIDHISYISLATAFSLMSLSSIVCQSHNTVRLQLQIVVTMRSQTTTYSTKSPCRPSGREGLPPVLGVPDGDISAEDGESASAGGPSSQARAPEVPLRLTSVAPSWRPKGCRLGRRGRACTTQAARCFGSSARSLGSSCCCAT